MPGRPSSMHETADDLAALQELLDRSYAAPGSTCCASTRRSGG